jgi:Short C-terminal domain
MGLVGTAFKAAVAVKVAHVVHDRIERRKQEQWTADGHPPETYPGTFRGVTDSVAGMLNPAAAAAAGSGTAAQPADGTMAGVVAQLRELATLKQEGMLTDAEFDEQKRRLLAQH